MDSKHKSNERHYTILDALPEHVFVFSESGIYIDVYGGEENATGFNCKPFIGKSLYDVTPPDVASMFHSYILKTLKTNTTQVVKYHFANENMLILPDDIEPPKELWFEGTIKPLPIIENGERTVVWMAKNVTQRHYLENKLKRLSETDELTGILNRRAFVSTLSNEIAKFHRYETKLACLMLDIDRFKGINDQMGHLAGDEVIIHIARLCKFEVRNIDYIGRLGGEEFAIILCHADENKALEVANRIRKKIEQTPCEVDNYAVDVTVSIGVSEIYSTDNSSEPILSRADRAMYHSKATGRNRVSVYSDKIDNIRINFNQENRIRRIVRQ